ncbi:MAG: signal peptidase I [Oscillospiraceae bacterium]|nr:signal peptidase I [Oscillospiraceae bacterium]
MNEENMTQEETLLEEEIEETAEEVTEETPKKSFWKENGSTVAMAVFVAIFALTLFTGLWKPVVVRQTSMYPTLHDRDYLFIVRTGDYSYGDIVVFNCEELRQDNLVKRIVAMPGDRIIIRDGMVILNGAVLQEEYLDSSVTTDGDVDLTVSEGCVFLLGDNRPVSIDSRAFGEVPMDTILGEAKLRLFYKPTLF